MDVFCRLSLPAAVFLFLGLLNRNACPAVRAMVDSGSQLPIVASLPGPESGCRSRAVNAEFRPELRPLPI